MPKRLMSLDYLAESLSRMEIEARPKVKVVHPDGSEGVIVDNHVVVTKGERLGESVEFAGGWRVVWGGG